MSRVEFYDSFFATGCLFNSFSLALPLYLSIYLEKWLYRIIARFCMHSMQIAIKECDDNLYLNLCVCTLHTCGNS